MLDRFPRHPFCEGFTKENPMKAVVFKGIGDIRLEDVPEPTLKEPTDAIVRLTASAICGTDLHMIRGTLSGMKPGTILGHEGVGVVEKLGKDVRNLSIGDRVIIPSTIACGSCSYCRAGYFSQCDKANPNGPDAGTAFYGGPKETGPFDGLQAEKARVPFAHANLVKIPDEVTDQQAVLLSDILPTGYFGAKLAEIRKGNTVAVFGCGPVGQFAILSAFLLGAGRVLAVDSVPDRLEMAKRQGAEAIDFNAEDPVAAILRLTGGIGVDRVIDAVGIDAVHPDKGPGTKSSGKLEDRFEKELEAVAPETPEDGDWTLGNAPSQALRWAVECVAKAGTLAIIGVYPSTAEFFPIGKAMGKNLTLKMGNCNHKRYIPRLLEMVRTGIIRPEKVITVTEGITGVIEAYHGFDEKKAGWIKVELEPAA
jgi:threonine dehydrogenase-like Zn-dependent dehydrogenase